MSDIRDLRSLDWVLLLIFVGALLYFALQAKAPEVPSTPGSHWPSAPLVIDSWDVEADLSLELDVLDDPAWDDEDVDENDGDESFDEGWD